MTTKKTKADLEILVNAKDQEIRELRGDLERTASERDNLKIALNTKREINRRLAAELDLVPKDKKDLIESQCNLIDATERKNKLIKTLKKTVKDLNESEHKARVEIESLKKRIEGDRIYQELKTTIEIKDQALDNYRGEIKDLERGFAKLKSKVFSAKFKILATLERDRKNADNYDLMRLVDELSLAYLTERGVADVKAKKIKALAAELDNIKAVAEAAVEIGEDVIGPGIPGFRALGVDMAGEDLIILAIKGGVFIRIIWDLERLAQLAEDYDGVKGAVNRAEFLRSVLKESEKTKEALEDSPEAKNEG